ncbi:MAG: VapC toxin family domain ribonuclease [Prosthecobacter sp.]|nr:VapC toxin family domain ribonuclease [Prosthecobacter sp.]
MFPKHLLLTSMEENVLIDSSFLIERLRKGVDPFAELAAKDDRYEFHTCGVVVAEVCRGITSRRLYERARENFAVMCWVPTDDAVWEEVTELAWTLARIGVTMQVTDMVIAVSALSVDAEVWTFDSDFHYVPDLRVVNPSK